MAGLVPAIHVLTAKTVDARNKAGHDKDSWNFGYDDSASDSVSMLLRNISR